jgi:hypothetical protein
MFFGACAVLVAAASGISVPAAAQSAGPLGGVWTLNRSLSEFPKEIGFNVDWVVPADPSDPAASSGRGRRASGGARPANPNPRRESSEDARRLQLLIGEVRNPPVRLMIVDTAAAVTITNELGQSRTLHPGREESIEIQGVPVTVATKREGARLVATYHVEQDRDVRYSYTVASNPSRVSVEVQLLEHGTGDKATRVYEAGTGTETAAPARAAAAPPPPGQAPPGQAPPGQAPPAGQPAAPGPAFDQRPNAEFRGLKTVGILVEDLGAEATACGLKREAIEDGLASRLSAGGLSVKRNSDDDTYVYVNVISTSSGTGCVSRYDAFLYSHATARLAYHEQPVLVQVSLMHRGGIGASTAAGHAGAVLRGLEGYVDLFIAQIRDANK